MHDTGALEQARERKRQAIRSVNDALVELCVAERRLAEAERVTIWWALDKNAPTVDAEAQS